MTLQDTLTVANIVASVLAIVAAPVIALYVNGRLQRRGDARAAKTALFSTLIGLRHNLFTNDTVKALNSIDAVFVDDPNVRELWSQLIAYLNDPNAQNPAGYAVRDAKRRDLMIAMVKSLGWENRITTADLLRVYAPNFTVEALQVELLERAIRKKKLIAEAQQEGIDPAFFGVTATPVHPAASMVSSGAAPVNGSAVAS